MKTILALTVLLAMPLPADVLPGGPSMLHDVALRCRETGVSIVVACRLIWAESRWYPRAIGDKETGGARSLGIMQLSEKYLPYYAVRFNGGQGIDPFNPRVSIRIGLRYLARLYARFGTWSLALAAYNAGPARVERGLIPRRTLAYIEQIVGAPPARRIK
jgi:soluble lytic murein transglycosylase-like protein